jgi:hypothetical protein
MAATGFSFLLAVAAGVPAAAPGAENVAGHAVALRDPLRQPFASTSIWNMPIGSAAV